MDFQWTQDQVDLKNMTQEFIAKEVVAIRLWRDGCRCAGCVRDCRKSSMKWGLLNLIVPEEYGGPGLDALTVAVLYEEIGKGCAGVATSIAANALAAYPVLLLGTEEQKKFFFDKLNEGKLAAFALTEPNAGSDAGGVVTSAVKDGNEYVLNGNKCFITNASSADIFVVFANTRKVAGIRGLTAFHSGERNSGLFCRKKRRENGNLRVRYLRTDSRWRASVGRTSRRSRGRRV